LNYKGPIKAVWMAYASLQLSHMCKKKSKLSELIHME